jgi:hypothetical protein
MGRLGPAFFYDPELPQIAEVNAVIVRFFDERLGQVRQRPP